MRGVPLAAGLRVARHYVRRLAEAAQRLGRAGEPDQERALEALRLDWPQIEPWQRWAAEGAEPERAALCLDFADGTQPALAVLLPPTGQLQWTLQAVAAAQALARAEAERRLLYQAALLHKNLEQVDALQALASQLAAHAQAANDTAALGRARLLQAHVADLRERREEAQAHYAASQAMLEPLGPSVELVEIWGGLTRLAFYAGRYPEALSHALQHLAVAKALGLHERIGGAHLSVTGAANYVEQPALSLEHAQQALASGERCGSLRLIAHAHVALGHACRRLGRLDEAVAHYQRGIAAPRSALPPSSLTNAYQGLAEAYEALGDRAQALATAERALALARTLPAVAGFRVCEAWRVIVRLRQGDASAREGLLAYAEAALRLGAPPHLCEVLLGVAEWSLAQGHTALATRCAAALRRDADTVRLESRERVAQVLRAVPADDTPAVDGPGDGLALEAAVHQVVAGLERAADAAPPPAPLRRPPPDSGGPG